MLVLFALAENFGFRQLMSLLRVRGFLRMLARVGGWGRMERRGFGATGADMRQRLVLAVILAVALGSLAAAPLGAASVRTIATVVLDTWFDGSFRTKVEDVTLVGVLPTLTLEARVSREDTAGWHGWQAGLGPVVNLTPNLYLVALYNLGVDSDAVFSHEIDASLNHETATTAVSLGLKGDWYPSTGYWYLDAVAGREVPPRRRPRPVRQGLRGREPRRHLGLVLGRGRLAGDPGDHGAGRRYHGLQRRVRLVGDRRRQRRHHPAGAAEVHVQVSG